MLGIASAPGSERRLRTLSAMTGDTNEQSVDGRPLAGFPVHGMDDPTALANPQRIGAELTDEPTLERVGGGFIDLRDARSVQYPAARAETHRERERGE